MAAADGTASPNAAARVWSSDRNRADAERGCRNPAPRPTLTSVVFAADDRLHDDGRQKAECGETDDGQPDE